MKLFNWFKKPGHKCYEGDIIEVYDDATFVAKDLMIW